MLKWKIVQMTDWNRLKFDNMIFSYHQLNFGLKISFGMENCMNERRKNVDGKVNYDKRNEIKQPNGIV